MSATTNHYHDTIETNLRPDFNPQKIADLRAEAKKIRDEIEQLQRLWYEAVPRRIHGLKPYKYPSGKLRLSEDIQREITEQNERLFLIISELDRRRI